MDPQNTPNIPPERHGVVLGHGAEGSKRLPELIHGIRPLLRCGEVCPVLGVESRTFGEPSLLHRHDDFIDEKDMAKTLRIAIGASPKVWIFGPFGSSRNSNAPLQTLVQCTESVLMLKTTLSPTPIPSQTGRQKNTSCNTQAAQIDVRDRSLVSPQVCLKSVFCTTLVRCMTF